MTAYIPEEYIGVSSTRLDFYQRLAAVTRAEDIEDIAQELKDRFGAMPQPVENLLYIVRMKQLASEAGVESIVARDKQIVLRFHDARELGRLALAHDYGDGVKVGTRQIRLDMKYLGDGWPAVLEAVLHEAVTST